MTDTERSSRRVQHGRKRHRHIISHLSPIFLNNHKSPSNLFFVVFIYTALLLLGLSQCPTVSAWALPVARRIVTLPSRSIPSRHFSGSLYQAISASAISTPSSTASTTTTPTTSSSASASSSTTTTSPVINHPGENDEEGNSAARRWLGILSKGSKIKGVSDVKLREAEELGGLPRSDRYSSRDWLHNTITLPRSAILRSIKGPVTFMTGWAMFLSLLFMRLEKINPVAAQAMSLPQSPHSLMVSALSLLLVFKTNSAYQRFAEGRKIWESIINISRDLYRLMNLYENEMGRTKRRRMQRLLAAFPYLLRHRIRPNLVMYRLDDEENVRDPDNSIVLYQDRAADDLDPEAAAVATQEENAGNSRRRTRPLYWVDKRTLPWRLLPKNALEACARAQNRPLWVCDRMGQELRTIPDGPHFTARERLTLISKVEKLSGCIGACERIHQTAVPLNYARHSLRALTLWLFTLPFALVGSLKLLTGPVLFLVSWLLFGVYEIGYSIEDPFQGTLRLSVLCDTIRRDVLADEVIRSTAFVMEEEDTDSGSTSSASIVTQAAAPRGGGGGDNDMTTAAAATAVEDDEVDGEGDNHRDYEESSVFKPPTATLSVENVVEEGLYDEEDRDYESSPVSREIPITPAKEMDEEIEMEVPAVAAAAAAAPKKPELVVEVEELPNIPIFSDLNSSSEYIRNDKKP